LKLGVVFDKGWEYTFPKVFEVDGVDISCWKELDQALERQPSLRSVNIRLVWKNKPETNPRNVVLSLVYIVPSCEKAIEMQEAWRENLKMFFARWRELFQRVEQRGILDLRYTWSPYLDPEHLSV
jgi:hypothetical protein